MHLDLTQLLNHVGGDLFVIVTALGGWRGYKFLRNRNGRQNPRNPNHGFNEGDRAVPSAISEEVKKVCEAEKQQIVLLTEINTRLERRSE